VTTADFLCLAERKRFAWTGRDGIISSAEKQTKRSMRRTTKMSSDTYSQITIKGDTWRRLTDLKVNDPRFAECKTISAVIVKLIEMNGDGK